MPGENADPPHPPTDNENIGASKVEGSVNVSDGSFTGRDHIEGFSGEDVKSLVDMVLQHFQENAGASNNQFQTMREVKELLEVITNRFQDSALRQPQEFDKMLSEFQLIQQELREWKSLHNYFDTTIQKFDQFSRAVQSSNFTSPNRQDLRNAWFPLGVELDKMLAWARTLRYIGAPYTDDGVNLGGVAWAGRLELTRREIERHINSNVPTGYKSTLFGLIRSTPQPDQDWVTRLTELASQYHTLVLSYMHEADDHLLDCATHLTETSEKFLRR